jgi:hypothetical protein
MDEKVLGSVRWWRFCGIHFEHGRHWEGMVNIGHP